jgi:hypothetical protein
VKVADLESFVSNTDVGVNTPAVPVPESAGVIVIGNGAITVAGSATVKLVEAAPFKPEVGPVKVYALTCGTWDKITSKA